MGDKTRPKRIFINDVDSYSSKYIAEFLAKCVPGGEISEEEETPASPEGEVAFHVVGTVSSSTPGERPSFLLERYTAPTKDALLKHLLQCDVVVYNISENATPKQIEEANWAVTTLHEEMENFKARKLFILVSTVMTWAMTRKEIPDGADDLPTEEEYRKRKPHPSFRPHHNLERHVLKMVGGKSKLKGYVVASGLQYGKGENLFHYFFKVSWLMQFSKVPVFGQATNYIPMIHVYDLAGVIQNLIEHKPKSKYILAIDDSNNSLEDVVKAISNVLGPEKINKLPDDDGIAMEAFKAEELLYLSINLRLDAFIIKDSLSLRWVSEGGIVENMQHIVEEYKNTRQLLPIRICLLGPPAVGKTTISEKLCSHYRLHHIQSKEVVEDKLVQLRNIVSGNDPENVTQEAIADAQKQLDNVNKSLEMNAGRLGDQLVVEILREKLFSKPCMNQGFVLDGFPETPDQARMMFSDEDAESPEPLSKAPVYNKITPEHVFALNASDNFLTRRVQTCPEDVAYSMNYTQDKFISRLDRYRQLSGAEETLVDYFDELEIHPEHMEIITDDIKYTEVIKKMIELVGLPKNYGLSPEEQEEENRRWEEERKQKEITAEAEKKRKSEEKLAEMAAQFEEWHKNLSEVKRQEDELLEAHAVPLRNYLMKYVMPSLTEAMLECCKIKPEDPIDFLAEHVLRNNQKHLKMAQQATQSEKPSWEF